MFHSLLALWFRLTLEWGYFGVFVLMAVESTVFPLPSEVVIPPAAYWASQGKLNFWGVVVAGTLGSWAGSALSYLAGWKLGRPLILRYGRYFFLPPKKWELAELWLLRYAAAGVFFARLLPVVRHLISIPAGAARMPFGVFSVMTLAGSFFWCTVLAWFGARVLSDEPRLLQDPEALSRVLHEKLWWFVAAAAVLFLLYLGVDLLGRRLKRQAGAAPAPSARAGEPR